MNPTTCRACGARIVFIRSANGRPIPCNDELVEIVAGGKTHNGPLVSVVTDSGMIVRGRRASGFLVVMPSEVVRGRIAHWATCPDADRFRRRRK